MPILTYSWFSVLFEATVRRYCSLVALKSLRYLLNAQNTIISVYTERNFQFVHVNTYELSD